MPKKSPKRRRHTAEFKAEAIRVMEQRGDRTIAEVAESLGVAANVLHAWKRSQDPNRSNDRGETTEQELQRLRRENATLRRDREALVKSLGVIVKDRK